MTSASACTFSDRAWRRCCTIGASWRCTPVPSSPTRAPCSLRKLLELGGDPDGPTPFANQPLHQAVWRGRSRRFFDLLFEFGADVNMPNKEGRTAYAMAARVGRQEIMRRLVEAGADTTMAPADAVLAACAAGDAAAARELLSSLSSADRAQICEVADAGNTACVGAMLELGWDVNTRGRAWKETPLHRAAIEGHLETVQLLLDHGADLTIRDACYHSSPVGWARHGGHHEVVAVLRDDPDRLDLLDAIDLGCTDRALALLDEHSEVADVNTAVAGGEPGILLRAAAQAGDTRLIATLLERGADAAIRNSEGKSAIDIARQQGHNAVVDLLGG